ncbi:TPA: glycosyltransferase [Enterobacter cloacae]|uniref:glycosyltransferase n=1 Tax=Enterobacter cloacae TaxID=550 RepID=UPI00111E7089|nr:glycosyltransferase [Enterobacter cloacae]MCF2229953.1 glycosyltransferase [Enterobacter cloacae]MDV5406147.1 glycosyltransferase [Enterobacter cloacae]TOZ47409.1 glycosyl transferase [Enterobacter cloacae]
MKVLILSNSDKIGGAAIAAYRLHRALVESNIDSRMMVRIKQSDDYTVIRPQGKLQKTIDKFRSPVGNIINKLAQTDNSGFYSGNWLPSTWSKTINQMDVDIVHIHWVGGETLSIEDLGKINKPIIWTFHDMWPFCGLEHYAPDDPESRWVKGYNRKKIIDLDRIVWRRKKRSWSSKIAIISPSNWLSKCIAKSALLKNNPLHTLPNILDISVFKPIEREFCRNILNLDKNKKIILFGAFGGSMDKRKGYDLLTAAVRKLTEKIPNIYDVQCLIFGQSKPEKNIDLPVEVKWLGHIHDDTTLALIYNAANIMVVPSRQDNLPQTATEAQACGCPVVAFNCTGFPDIISHRKTGYLADPFDSDDLATGIAWLLNNPDQESSLGENASSEARKKWSSVNLMPQYLKLYQDTIDKYSQVKII